MALSPALQLNSMSLFRLFIASLAWEDVRQPFWLHTLVAFVLWGACHVGEFAVQRCGMLGLHLGAISWPCMVGSAV